MGPMCSIILYIFSLRMRQTPKAHSIQMINNASIERSINLFFIPTETLHFRHLHHLSFYLLSYRVCFLHLRWVTLDDSYSSTIEFLCYEQPCFLLRFFFSHLNQLNSRSRGKQGKNGLVRVCIYNGQEKEATSIEGLYSRQGVKREREREREREIFVIDSNSTRLGVQLWQTVYRRCTESGTNIARNVPSVRMMDDRGLYRQTISGECRHSDRKQQYQLEQRKDVPGASSRSLVVL